MIRASGFPVVTGSAFYKSALAHGRAGEMPLAPWHSLTALGQLWQEDALPLPKPP